MPEATLVDTVIEAPAWTAAGLPELAETAARRTLEHLGHDPGDFEIALLGCDDARIAALNADFRGRPTPTNVLSWPSQQFAPHPPGAVPGPPADTELGDIAIAFETCAREAGAADKPFSAHTTHLVVHATLHLLGYDHTNDADAAIMEAIETDILATLGLDDPYA